MAVNVERNADFAMPEKLLNDLAVFASLKKHGCEGMACVMEADAGKTGFL